MENKDLNIDEIWKDIKDYEGIYQVSNLGNVRCLAFRNNRYTIPKIFIKKQTMDKHGYFRVMLQKDKKMKLFQVHRLVAQTFIPNPNKYKEVNHKDENPKNNKIDNLEWCTHKYNMQYSNVIERIAKANRKPINQYNLDGDLIKKWESAQQIQNEINISKQCISYACKNRTQNTKGYIWRYANE